MFLCASVSILGEKGAEVLVWGTPTAFEEHNEPHIRTLKRTFAFRNYNYVNLALIILN